MSDAKKTSKAQRHVTTACVACRKKKVKCDGNPLKCYNCSMYNQECVYELEKDRRKISSRKLIDDLTARVKLLEDTLILNGIEVPSTEQLPVDSQIPSITPATEIPGPQNPSIDARVETHAQKGPIVQSVASHISWESNRPDSFSKSEEKETDAIVDQLSNRMGSLQVAEDGQLRYFGATSNLHILHNGPLSLSQSSIRYVQDDHAAILGRAGVGQHIDSELEEHLIELYFAWEDPIIHVVDKAIYHDERKQFKAGKRGSAFYSEVLTNAMCSFGAALTSRQLSHIAGNAAEYFGLRAKALLEVEMDSPTVATVQALIVLSSQEAAFTRDARGWLYSGMALRLVFDLGLHLDIKGHSSASDLSPREAGLRSTTFWGSFVLDRLWSLYVGRPPAIHSEIITAPLPSSFGAHITQGSWDSYIDKDLYGQVRNTPDLLGLISQQMVSLCDMIARICQTLYTDSTLSLRHLHTFATGMKHNLRDWLLKLPREVCVDLENEHFQYLPHVIQLHMQYHEVIILLYRPFLSYRACRAASISGDEVLEAKEACSHAASTITKLLQMYQRLYTLRRINITAVHITFTTALVHLFEACNTQYSSSATRHESLQTCCQALSKMGQAYKSASRALEVITCIKCKWQEGPTGSQSIKRGGTATDELHDDRTKRPRFTHNAPSFAPLGTPDTFDYTNSSDMGLFLEPHDLNLGFWMDSNFWLDESLFANGNFGA